MNDLGAWGHSIDHLAPDEIRRPECRQSRIPAAPAPCLRPALASANPFLFWDGTRYRVVPSEGGHSDFAPAHRAANRTAEVHEPPLSASQLGIDFVRPRLPHDSRISRADGEASRHSKIPTPIPLRKSPRADLEKTCPVCVETLDLWTAIYGAEAGNLALKVLSLGGVYVAGGIAIKIIAEDERRHVLRSVQGQMAVRGFADEYTRIRGPE